MLIFDSGHLGLFPSLPASLGKKKDEKSDLTFLFVIFRTAVWLVVFFPQLPQQSLSYLHRQTCPHLVAAQVEEGLQAVCLWFGAAAP